MMSMLIVRSGQWRCQFQILGGAKYFDFKRATVFSLGHRLSNHKTTRYVRNMGGHSPFPLATPMEVVREK